VWVWVCVSLGEVQQLLPFSFVVRQTSGEAGRAVACQGYDRAGRWATRGVGDAGCRGEWRRVRLAWSPVCAGATLDGKLAAVGPVPIHGARHDAHAYAASGLADILLDYPTVADLGYVGVNGIDDVPVTRAPGADLQPEQTEFNTALSKIRAAVEHAIAHLKTWRMLSEEKGRYRAPIKKYEIMIKTIVGLYFFATYE
jgi:hypothetical protein